MYHPEVPDRLYDLLDRLTKREQQVVLLDALELMQQYNGQSVGDVICRALEAEEIDDDDGRRWRLPSMAEIKRNLK